MMNDSLKRIGEQLMEAQSLLFFPHILMDGDALGSAAALCHILREKGKKAYIVIEDKVPDYLAFLDRDYTIPVEKVSQLGITEPDVTLCIDCGEVHRFPKREGWFAKGRTRICIDHHLPKEGSIANYNYVDPEAAATGEIVYDLLKEMNVSIDQEAAEALFTAITTDTGNYQHANTTKKSHVITADLYTYGLDSHKVSRALYENEPLRKLKLHSLIMDTARQFAGGEAAMAYMTQAMLTEAEALPEDSEGVVSTLRSIRGVEVSALAKEQEDGTIKVSLRSLTKGDVAALSQKHGGGGHVHAAGCTFQTGDMETVLATMEEEITAMLEAENAALAAKQEAQEAVKNLPAEDERYTLATKSTEEYVAVLEKDAATGEEVEEDVAIPERDVVMEEETKEDGRDLGKESAIGERAEEQEQADLSPNTDSPIPVGILNVYKPQDYTSFDCVAIVRGAAGTRKVGHTGTLDPMATGVLPVCIGSATRILEYLDEDTKVYRATLKLGLTTDTCDIWGKVESTRSFEIGRDLPEIQVRRFMKFFVGDTEQTPPAYAAIKVNGKKLYEYAREGKKVEVAPRPVTIYSLEIDQIRKDEVDFTVVCSKGTYIRSLCRDIGEMFGCGGCMAALERVRTGVFEKGDTVSIEDVKTMSREELAKRIIPMDVALQRYPKLRFSMAEGKDLTNGKRIAMKGRLTPAEATINRQETGDLYRLYAEDIFVGMGTYDFKEDVMIPDKILNGNIR